MARHQPEARHEVQFVTVHGHRRAFVKVGQGRPCCSSTGSAATTRRGSRSSRHWHNRYTVIAPDLLGHGLWDKPRAEYSVGGYANGN